MINTKTKSPEDNTFVYQTNRKEDSDKESFRRLSLSSYNELIKKKRKIALDEFDPGTKFKMLPDLEKALRIIFIRKMWSVFSLQVIGVFGLMFIGRILAIRQLLFLPSETNKTINIAMISALAGFAMLLLLLQRYTKRSPFNFISFALWTLVEAFLLMIFYIKVNLNPFTISNAVVTPGKEGQLEILILTIIMIVGVLIGLALYCFIIKTDFNFFLALFICFVILAALVVGFSIPTILAAPPNIFELIQHIMFTGIGVLGLSIYLVFDIMINLNKIRRKYQLEDWFIAGLNIYIDPINIFANVVTCLEY